MSRLNLMIHVLAFLALVACHHPEEPPQPAAPVAPQQQVPLPDVSADATKIIFAGNSLTASNNVPALIIELGKMEGREIAAEVYAPGGYSLEDHWNEGAVQRAMKRTKFDFFVGQQGPSSLQESLVLLKEYAALYAEACEEQQTRFALYMVWPDKSRAAYHDAVIANYTEAADATGAILCPAGLAWKEAWKVNASLPLYGPDQFHPSMTGSVLAALTIYAALFEKSSLEFVNYEDASWKNQVSPQTLDILKRAALESIKR